MNQDCLENFFGNIRSVCHNTKSVIATQFKTAFTTVFMTNSMAHSMKSNCEPDSSIPLLTDIHLLMLQKGNVVNDKSPIENDISKNDGTASIGPNNCYPYNSDTNDNPNDVASNIIEDFDNQNYDPIIFEPEFSEKEINIIDEEAISNLSKSVFDKLLQNTHCDECRSTLETSSNDNSIKFPSNLFVQNFKKIFYNIDESLQYICADKGLKKEVLKSLENVGLDEMGCENHLSCVESKFKEFSTIFGIISFCKRINNILSRKNKVYSEHFNLIEELAFTFHKKKKGIGKHSEKFD